MELFFFDYRKLGRLGSLDIESSLAERAYRVGEHIPNGMPFLLDGDGKPEQIFCRYVRSLPSVGVTSPHSWRAYAYDLFRFLRFLQDLPVSKQLTEVDKDDIAAYRAARIAEVSPATWNREVAALEGFYSWVVENGYTNTSPFAYRTLGKSTRSVARAKLRTAPVVKYLTYEQWRFFLTVGLENRLPDGRMDPRSRSRHDFRNSLFARLLMSTGLRREEAASLLACEIPTGRSKPQTLWLGTFTTKGNRPRQISLSRRILSAIDVYRKSDRVAAIETANATHPIRASLDVDPVVVDWTKRQVIIADGRTRDWDKLTIDERKRLFTVDAGYDEPLALFIGDGGRQVLPDTWDKVFERASARCKRVISTSPWPDCPEMPESVYPHMLRHTFAILALSDMMRHQVSSRKTGSSEDVSWRSLYVNPLRRLQYMLGHAHLDSTWVYLDCLKESAALVDKVITHWEMADGDQRCR